MKKALGLMAGLALVASSALASNTGFKLNYPLTFDAALSSTNWVSLPYFYYPNGNVGTAQVANDICVDVNGAPSVATPLRAVVRWNSLTDTVTTKFCVNATAGFPLVPGASYSFVPAVAGVTPAIVGSHDDTYAANKGGTATIPLVFDAALSSTNWISVPYHSTATVCQDLCVAINGAPAQATPLRAIVRWNSATDTVTTKFCVNGTPGPTVDPGLGFSFVPAVAGLNIQFDVY